MKNRLQKSLCPLVIIMSINLAVVAQQEAFIYGEVEMKDHTRHEGKITWGAGQTMWVDLIIVEKKDNPVLKYLNAEELKKLSEEEEKKQMDWGFMTLWENQYPSRKLTLRCQFGHIAAITVRGSEDADIILKNGEKIRVYINDDQEYKDQLGSAVRVHTSEDDKLTLAWDQILKINFMTSPGRLPQFDGVPLYGTVLTKTGYTYTGLIKWDMYEHLNSQYLDGNTIEGRKTRYVFREIQSIRPKDDGSLIQLRSGKEIYLHEHDDVTKRNGGILVRNPLWGQVVVKWSDFKMATFSPYPSDCGFAYENFEAPRELKGTVTTVEDNTWTGDLVYDLDEKTDIETIDGWDNGKALRQVPFRLIDEIYPVSRNHTAVLLKDGKKLILGERSDVDHDNWGIMVKLRGDAFKYIPWEKVKNIRFD